MDSDVIESHDMTSIMILYSFLSLVSFPICYSYNCQTFVLEMKKILYFRMTSTNDNKERTQITISNTT